MELHGQANVTVSIIELWADAPRPDSLRFSPLVGLPSSVQGRVVDLTFEGVAQAPSQSFGSGQPGPHADGHS